MKRRKVMIVLAVYCLLVASAGGVVLGSGDYRLSLPVVFSRSDDASLLAVPSGPETPTGSPACLPPPDPGVGWWLCVGETAVPYVSPTPAPTATGVYLPTLTPQPYPAPGGE